MNLSCPEAERRSVNILLKPGIKIESEPITGLDRIIKPESEYYFLTSVAVGEG